MVFPEMEKGGDWRYISAIFFSCFLAANFFLAKNLSLLFLLLFASLGHHYHHYHHHHHHHHHHLALLRCVGVSVVVDDVVLREVTGPFHKVPTHSSLVHRGGERRRKQEDEDREERLHFLRLTMRDRRMCDSTVKQDWLTQ